MNNKTIISGTIRQGQENQAREEELHNRGDKYAIAAVAYWAAYTKGAEDQLWEDINNHSRLAAPSLPLSLGDQVWFLLEDDREELPYTIVGPVKVTGIGFNGFCVPNFTDDPEDAGCLYGWNELGNDIFGSAEAAAKRMAELMGGREESLQPCPFCGSEEIEVVDNSDPAFGDWLICCENCGGAFIASNDAMPVTRAELIARWNSRWIEAPGGIQRAAEERAADCRPYGGNGGRVNTQEERI